MKHSFWRTKHGKTWHIFGDHSASDCLSPEPIYEATSLCERHEFEYDSRSVDKYVPWVSQVRAPNKNVCAKCLMELVS